MKKTGQAITASDFVYATTAGEALSARDAVYISTSDGKAYKCDADLTTALRFAGFAQEAAALNAAVNVLYEGHLGGFSALTPGARYFLSGTAGAITATAGTYEVPIARALNATTVLIDKGQGFLSGTTTFSATATLVITTGFKVRHVRIHAQVAATGSTDSHSHGGYTVGGGNQCVFLRPGVGTAGGVDATKAWIVGDGTDVTNHSGIIDTITDTTFRLNNTEAAGTHNIVIYWEAEGDF